MFLVKVFNVTYLLSKVARCLLSTVWCVQTTSRSLLQVHSKWQTVGSDPRAARSSANSCRTWSAFEWWLQTHSDRNQKRRWPNNTSLWWKQKMWMLSLPKTALNKSLKLRGKWMKLPRTSVPAVCTLWWSVWWTKSHSMQRISRVSSLTIDSTYVKSKLGEFRLPTKIKSLHSVKPKARRYPSGLFKFAIFVLSQGYWARWHRMCFGYILAALFELLSIIMNNSLQIWFDAARPKTLPLALVSIFTGSALAFFFWTLLFADRSSGAADRDSIADFIELSQRLWWCCKGTDNEKRIGPMRATTVWCCEFEWYEESHCYQRTGDGCGWVDAGFMLWIVCKAFLRFIGLGVLAMWQRLLIPSGKQTLWLSGTRRFIGFPVLRFYWECLGHIFLHTGNIDWSLFFTVTGLWFDGGCGA